MSDLRMVHHGTKKNSARIPSRIWEAHKDVIVPLYVGSTLKITKAVMEDEHGFAPSRRQYVHQLKKWGVLKYQKKMPDRAEKHNLDADCTSVVGKKRRKSDSQEKASGLTASRNMSEPPERDAESEYDSFSAATCSEPEDDGFDLDQPRYCLRQKAGDAYGIVECIDPRLDGLNSQQDLPRGSRERALKHAADCFFAMSGDQIAFPLFVQVYESLTDAVGCSTPVRERLAISIARSAQTGPHRNVACNILKSVLASGPEEKDPGAILLFRSLIAYMQDRTGEKETARRAVTELMEDIITNRDLVRLIRPRTTCIDVATYQCLVYCIHRYNEAWGADQKLDARSILTQFLSHQPISSVPSSGKTVQEGSHNRPQRQIPCVTACVSWCLSMLKTHRRASYPLAEVPCPSEQLRLWRDDYEIFLHLWGHLQHDKSASTHPPTWAQAAEPELGISASEVLVTVSWLIMDNAQQSTDVGRRGATARTDHDGDLISRALEGARRVDGWDGGALYQRFLAKFDWMNSLEEAQPEDKAFKAAALERVREYVEDVLGVRLPPTSPHAEEPKGFGGKKVKGRSFVPQ
ncbi:hypothetical protein NKR23_g9843 [Pleurostoma richardsiae]|uniref:Clr5 domain-containing protein n=1 Tax=Pleurostoma richardsiae TaxID=41990 RepID=A0AA38VEM2_9PEZI|nr:hypothetical protein NKR23_g9843 [Pleurostoma richardsiae]